MAPGRRKFVPAFNFKRIFFLNALMNYRLSFLLISLLALTTQIGKADNKPDYSRVQFVSDVNYLGSGRKEKMDIYLPIDSNLVQHPAILIIHGGGWYGGDKHDVREQITGTNLARNGYVCASINYALCNAGDTSNPSWPQNIYDCKKAVQFLRKNSAVYKIDPNHIGVIGGSAGGHLAALLGVAGVDAGLEPTDGPYVGISTKVQAVIDMYGISDLTTWNTSAGQRYLGCALQSCPDTWHKASPVYNVTTDDPPFMILHGTKDATVPLDQSLLFVEELEKNKVHVELMKIEGAPHSFAIKMKDLDLRPAIITFLDKYLKGSSLSHDFSSYHRKTLSWNCKKIKKEIDLHVYFKDVSTVNEPAPVIVYVQNSHDKKIGLEADDNIIADLLRQRYVVITADFNNYPDAFSPYFDDDLYEIFKAIYGEGSTSILKKLNLEPIKYQCYFLPAGYRIERNIEFWDIQKHGAQGTMQHIVDTYNKFIVKKYDKPFGVEPNGMLTPDNTPLSSDIYKLRMDIIYPSIVAENVPLICNFCTNQLRDPYGDPKAKETRMHMAGFAMRGYACAFIDHCWNPLVRYYGYFGSFTLDPFNGLAANTAAIRYLRGHAARYNIDPEYIGAWGHSKGAYAVTRLSDPNHERQKENKLFDTNQKSPEPQPWPGYSSKIAVGYQSMGFGTMEHEYVKSNYVPTIIACGEYDPYGSWKDWPDLVKTYEDKKVNYLALGMLHMGHTFPSGFDKELNADRYVVCQTFFDQYLKIKENLPPAVLYVKAVKNNVIVHFAPVMDLNSVMSGLEIFKMPGDTKVNGQWKTSRGNTMYTFMPDNDDAFMPGQKYKLIIKDTVRNERGTPFNEKKFIEFEMK
jgi:acetyl esterase/lipase